MSVANRWKNLVKAQAFSFFVPMKLGKKCVFSSNWEKISAIFSQIGIFSKLHIILTQVG